VSPLQKRSTKKTALGVGLKEKAEEFVAASAEIYQTTNTLTGLRINKN
jgi:hypothetical protein